MLYYFRPTEREATERHIRTKLKELMMSVDLDEVTSKYVSFFNFMQNEFYEFNTKFMFLVFVCTYQIILGLLTLVTVQYVYMF